MPIVNYDIGIWTRQSTRRLKSKKWEENVTNLKMLEIFRERKNLAYYVLYYVSRTKQQLF